MYIYIYIYIFIKIYTYIYNTSQYYQAAAANDHEHTHTSKHTWFSEPAIARATLGSMQTGAWGWHHHNAQGHEPTRYEVRKFHPFHRHRTSTDTITMHESRRTTQQSMRSDRRTVAQGGRAGEKPRTSSCRTSTQAAGGKPRFSKQPKQANRNFTQMACPRYRQPTRNLR